MLEVQKTVRDPRIASFRRDGREPELLPTARLNRADFRDGNRQEEETDSGSIQPFVAGVTYG